MSELSVEAPLAKSEDWEGDFGDFQACDQDFLEQLDQANCNSSQKQDGGDRETINEGGGEPSTKATETCRERVDNAAFADSNFLDMNLMAGSLEDLVNSFDEKISNCFTDYDEEVDKLAPVQVRSQEEVINDCQ